MQQYNVNSVYTLNVNCIQDFPDGRKYILFDQSLNGRQLRVRAFDFLTQLDADLPATIDVIVDRIDPMSGMPLFKINRDWLINTLYRDEKLPKKFGFNVVEKIDNEKYKSLVVKDSYGVIHYFPIAADDSLDNYSEGERIVLFAESINTNAKGGLYLCLSKPSATDPIAQYIRAFTTREDVVDAKPEVVAPSKTAAVTNYGEESEIVEFKQSLVFHPKSSKVNVDGQVFNIMRSIAGFMNHIGGVLYIGVKDDGSPSGIEADYPELNKAMDDSFNNYSANWDGWSRKLIDSVRKYLGLFAATLINVQKIEENNMVVAKVVVSKSIKPIYLNNKTIFRRQCNTTAMLTGDDLSYFIIERLRGESLEQFINQKLGYETEVVDSIDDKEERESSAGVASIITDGALDDERNHNKWLNLRLFDDGCYIITQGNAKDEKYNKGSLICDYQLKQYHKNENQILLMIYNGKGKVNKIDFVNGKNDWYYVNKHDVVTARQSSAPWVLDSNIEVRCVDRNDMVVAFYKDGDKDYCYVRDVMDINPSHSDRSKALFTEGHSLPTRGAKMCGNILHIPGTYRNWIAPIVNKQIELSDPKKKGTINRLINVLEELYSNKVVLLD